MILSVLPPPVLEGNYMLQRFAVLVLYHPTMGTTNHLTGVSAGITVTKHISCQWTCSTELLTKLNKGQSPKYFMKIQYMHAQGQ